MSAWRSPSMALPQPRAKQAPAGQPRGLVRAPQVTSSRRWRTHATGLDDGSHTNPVLVEETPQFRGKGSEHIMRNIAALVLMQASKHAANAASDQRAAVLTHQQRCLLLKMGVEGIEYEIMQRIAREANIDRLLNAYYNFSAGSQAGTIAAILANRRKGVTPEGKLVHYVVSGTASAVSRGDYVPHPGLRGEFHRFARDRITEQGFWKHKDNYVEFCDLMQERHPDKLMEGTFILPTVAQMSSLVLVARRAGGALADLAHANYSWERLGEKKDIAVAYFGRVLEVTGGRIGRTASYDKFYAECRELLAAAGVEEELLPTSENMYNLVTNERKPGRAFAKWVGKGKNRARF